MSKPVVVIRKVEDSPVWLDQRLVEAYLHTAYTIFFTELPPIRIGEANAVLEDWLDQRHFNTYAFITAWNPGSKPRTTDQNKLRNDQLKPELKKVSRLVLSGIGNGDPGKWTGEASFWALDVAAEEAIRLGRKYGQNAIVWWEKGGLPELWWL